MSKEQAAELLLRLEVKINAPEGFRDPNDPHAPPGVGAPKRVRSTEELDEYIKNMEENLNTVGDDAQLANVDLQNVLQKQQQTLTMMSNISKILHDTAMAIMRKIGA